MPKKEDLSIKLIRHLLGSIDLSDVDEEEKDMSETERKEYCAAIFAIWPRLKKDLKKMLYTQLMFSSNEAETWERVVFGRGTFNGLDLMYDKWEKAATEFESMPKEDKQDFNKNNPISEI